VPLAWCYKDNTEYERLMELKEQGQRYHPLETRKRCFDFKHKI